jgi:hypothetical protein
MISVTGPKGRDMVKRLFWLTVGFWLGVGVTIHATRTLRRSVERYLPPGAADRLRDMNNALDDRAALIRARRLSRRAS